MDFSRLKNADSGPDGGNMQLYAAENEFRGPCPFLGRPQRNRNIKHFMVNNAEGKAHGWLLLKMLLNIPLYIFVPSGGHYGHVVSHDYGENFPRSSPRTIRLGRHF